MVNRQKRSARILRAVRRHLACGTRDHAGKDARDPHAGCVRSAFAVYDLRSYNFGLILMRKKILTRDELLIERRAMREAGKKLIFTNGVFDILHVGHLRYLRLSRTLGDALVVAVNSDRSVHELKGEGRPVTAESDRAEILAGLETVDYVTIFDDISPRSLIAELLPDVLVKGGDYSLEQIHGREEVEAAGGSVVSVPLVEGISTTNILKKALSIKKD
jgi:D-beta-D-heptose 7-phosphate kinase/D-beta-D-heptose 1-phosphate adenosyltransferase